MKRFLAVTCMLMLLISICVLPTSAAGSGSLSVSGATGKQGDTVTLSVRLSSNPGLISMKFTVSYPSDLELTNVSNTGTLGGWTTPSPSISSPYTIRWADSLAAANSTATGTLVTLTFKIRDSATPGTKTVSINFSESRDVDGGKNSFNSPSATVQVNCRTHSFGPWAKASDQLHSRSCTACGTAETQDHSWGSGVVTENPSCHKEGVKTFTCSVCSGTRTQAVEKTPHTYGSWAKVDNNTHARTCTACPAQETADHTWNAGAVTKPATCKEEGIKTFTCTTCHAVKTEKIEKTEDHNFGAWTGVDNNSHGHTCAVCGRKETKDHTWNNGAVTKPATCKDEGVKTFTCTACHAVKTEKIEKLDTHKFGSWTKVDANTHTRVCSVCDQKETGDHGYSSRWSSNSREHWHECSVCKDKKDVTSHTPGPQATEQKPQTCTVCKYIIKPALEHRHDYADTYTTDETGHWYDCPGCEEQGSYEAHDFENACDPDCSVCGFKRETSHDIAQTWSSDGSSHWYECINCGLKESAEAHIPGAEATEAAPQTCTVCGYELAPALTPDPTETEAAPEDTDGTAVTPADGEKDFPWIWVVILGAAATVVLFVIVIVGKKKK